MQTGKQADMHIGAPRSAGRLPPSPLLPVLLLLLLLVVVKSAVLMMMRRWRY